MDLSDPRRSVGKIQESMNLNVKCYILIFTDLHLEFSRLPVNVGSSHSGISWS
jgi:hypothetical protein